MARARFDAAATTPENARHWANADGLSASAANSPEVRRVLRNRARYESANNSYCRGIVLTLANASISTGPRLQVQTGNDAANNRIEAAFGLWAELVRLPEKLRTMRQARAVDGETFALLRTNPQIDHEVTLDLQLIEADQVADPSPWPWEAVAARESAHVDGIDFDGYGNPVTYSVLTEHPGSTRGGYYQLGAAPAITVPAKFLIHWFRQDRPGQARGVPDLTPALPLFAQLRRYTLAVIAAAELAADYAGVFRTNLPPNLEGPLTPPPDGEIKEDYPAWGTVPVEPRSFMKLPEGWDVSQLTPQQPASSYADFTARILNEIARCLEMPFAVAAGNSSGYNYASGRLDFQVFGRAVAIERGDIERAILRRIFEAWLDEAALLPGYLPAGLPARNVPHAWYWPGERHVDPLKEAQAQTVRLANRTTTYADEYAAEGQDWKTQLTQLAREREFMLKLGLATAVGTPPPEKAAPDEKELEEEESQEEEEEEEEEADAEEINDDDDA
jgi:lambda family phage portal protein